MKEKGSTSRDGTSFVFAKWRHMLNGVKNERILGERKRKGRWGFFEHSRIKILSTLIE